MIECFVIASCLIVGICKLTLFVGSFVTGIVPIVVQPVSSNNGNIINANLNIFYLLVEQLHSRSIIKVNDRSQVRLEAFKIFDLGDLWF